MALDVYFKEDIAAMLTAPIAAAWPRLTPAERALVEWLVRCQLASFGVKVGEKVEVRR
ncbi:MAG TPA: hypothetical protein VM537_31820 [Anaerolineae bacterium]|nr:hypothetical protein [Anaerolineae bacterium]